MPLAIFLGLRSAASTNMRRTSSFVGVGAALLKIAQHDMTDQEFVCYFFLVRRGSFCRPDC